MGLTNTESTTGVRGDVSIARKRGTYSSDNSGKDEKEDTVVEKVEKAVNAVLHTWHEIPVWQQDNHFIISGYVKETGSFRKCIESLFYIHNETGNIYSHLIPSVLYLLLACVGWLVWVEKYPTTTITDFIMFLCFYAGGASCLGMSSAFHCFKCHSHKVSKLWNKLDYLGIVFLITGSSVGIIYYSFVDIPKLMYFFIALTTILGLICSIVSLDTHFSHHTWRPFRATMFILFGLSAVFPVTTGIYIYGYEEAKNRAQLPYVFTEGFLYIVGAVLYACRVPERYSPGKFDYWGHSHQIFHVLVVMASISHARALSGSYHYYHSNLSS